MKYRKQDDDYLCYSSNQFGDYMGRIKLYFGEWKFYPDPIAKFTYIELRQLYNKIYLLTKKLKIKK